MLMISERCTWEIHERMGLRLQGKFSCEIALIIPVGCLDSALTKLGGYWEYGVSMELFIEILSERYFQRKINLIR
jgi:hypothetical protein